MDVKEKNLYLTIDIGDEYISKIESLRKFEDSFFREVYLKAFKSVEEILENNKKNKKNYENYNNIIAFTGERGTGKTSTMLSVSEVLKGSSKEEEFFSKNKIELKNYKFFELDVIDPSHFQKKSNIIEIILAKMFERFKKLVEDNGEKENGKKREVIENFEKVFKDIKIISNGGGVEGEAIDALLNMSASSDLKGHLEKLIKSYLEFVNPTEDKKILVLEIDDLDLNTKYGYEMIEHIRKYLIIKNVVILMAVKIEQLSLVIERNTRKEFKELIKAGQISDEKINLMSDKYLKKLIPLERRLYMPDLEIESESKKIKIINGSNDKKEEEIIDKKVRSLIYHKTGMEFIDGKYIVPNNLRDLVNIISFLEKMDDLDADCTNKTMTNNFLIWKEYIFEIWIKKYLSIKQQQILKELYERDVEEKNKYIINKLEGLYDLLEKDDKFRERREYDIKKYKKMDDEGYSNTEKEYQDIINLNNNPKNICLGDVLFVLDKAKKYKVELQDQRFIYAIKMVYSIMLSEVYEKNEYKEKERLIKKSFGEKISKEELEEKIEIFNNILRKEISNKELREILNIFIENLSEESLKEELKVMIGILKVNLPNNELKEILREELKKILKEESGKILKIFTENLPEEELKEALLKKLKNLSQEELKEVLRGGWEEKIGSLSKEESGKILKIFTENLSKEKLQEALKVFIEKILIEELDEILKVFLENLPEEGLEEKLKVIVEMLKEKILEEKILIEELDEILKVFLENLPEEGLEEKLKRILKVLKKDLGEKLKEALKGKLKWELRNLIDLCEYKKLLGGYLYHTTINKFMRNSQYNKKSSKFRGFEDTNINRDRILIYNDKVKKLKSEEIYDFLKIFCVKTNKIYKENYFSRDIRIGEEMFLNNIQIEKSERIEFDILGFLYNIKIGDFYIRNIEILENILSRDYSLKNYKHNDEEFVEHFIEFIKKYKESIELNFENEKIELFNEKGTFKFIEKFIEKLIEKESFRKCFDKLIMPRSFEVNMQDLQKRSEITKKIREKNLKIEEIKDKIDNINKKSENKGVKEGALKSLKIKITKYLNLYLKFRITQLKMKELFRRIENNINIKDFIKYSDNEGNITDGKKEYGKKSEVRAAIIEIIKEVLKPEGTEE